ncbi:uncharacterized protein F4822DRAFT_362569 [Hypoxylon trugodes]|uniref:uncharacterized protein n=1 Tax=Hypoxylon trugodes TaxID=326681 RepID=UPI002198DED0|nr:uncharacterized protein F4822DRAFT_362569 [Hypoxylon trugodes]KAI1384398.1 hypothetical protein F4822DRAFT_362569 [Hypoxylon trugodes]
MPLADWNRRIQPNTIISILTTVIRSSMMIPVASCIGQYKWWHFRRPEKLKDLQSLDEASRGPWGSLMLLFDIKLWGPTIAFYLGAVTILALGIEPSAQQILAFPTRQAQLPNITAGIGAVTNWTTEASASTDTSLPWTRFKAAVLNGGIGSPQPADFYCPTPATQCSWDDFTTLALCGDITDFCNNTSAVNVTCWTNNTIASQCGSTEDAQVCNYTFPLDSSAPPIYLGHNSSNVVPMLLSGFGDQCKPNLQYGFWTSVEEGGFAGTKLGIVRPPSIQQSYSPDEVELYLITWQWCARTVHNLTATPGGVEFHSMTEENLVTKSTDRGWILEAPSTGLQYYSYAPNWFDFLEDSFTSDILASAPDMKNLTRNIADTISNLVTSNNTIRSQNLRTVPGKAYHEEVYIHVRWYWLILPILETVLTGIFLAASIALSRHQPLFKNSILSYLAHGLEGWRRGEPDVEYPESTDKLQGILGERTAKLDRGGDGQLKLRRCVT